MADYRIIAVSLTFNALQILSAFARLTFTLARSTERPDSPPFPTASIQADGGVAFHQGMPFLGSAGSCNLRSILSMSEAVIPASAANLCPQYRHTDASPCTYSAQAGHFFMPDRSATLSRCGELTAAITKPIRGLRNSERKKKPAPLRPLWFA